MEAPQRKCVKTRKIQDTTKARRITANIAKLPALSCCRPRKRL